MKYLPIALLFLAIVLISIGVFLVSIEFGFIVTGVLVAMLAYMVAPKGDQP